MGLVVVLFLDRGGASRAGRSAVALRRRGEGTKLLSSK